MYIFIGVLLASWENKKTTIYTPPKTNMDTRKSPHLKGDTCLKAIFFGIYVNFFFGGSKIFICNFPNSLKKDGSMVVLSFNMLQLFSLF